MPVATSTTIGTIMSALISAAATTTAGVMSVSATKKAGERQLELSGIASDKEERKERVRVGLKKRELGLAESKFGYEKMMTREMANKNAIANLGSSLKSLSKSGMEMQGFINSLYGNTLKGMS